MPSSLCRRSTALAGAAVLVAVAPSWVVPASAAAAPVGVPVPGVQGTVVAWGSNQQGQATVPAGQDDVVAVAASEAGCLLLHADGTVTSFGFQPAPVPADLDDVVAIAGGRLFNLALRADGTVIAWGWGEGVARLPSGLSDVTAIAAGGDHAVALRSDGTVVSWGSMGLLLDPVTAPDGLDGVVAVTAEHDQSYALKDDGTVVSWPYENYAPAGLDDVVALSSGLLHTLALRVDGSIVGWGQNHDGALDVPAGLTDVTAIAAGSGCSYALRSDGTVVAWGWNQDGKTTVPAGLTDVTAISVGYGHVLALVAPPAQLTAAAPSATATVGTTYSYAFTASGLPAPRFTISSGTLPAGLVLDPTTGTLTGTPTTAGASTFTVTAANGRGSGATSAPLTITVAAAPVPPTSPPMSPPTSPPTQTPSPAPTGFTPPSSPPVGDGALGVEQQGTPAVRVVPGSTVTFTATGYLPASTVTFVAYSAPTVLGTAVADAAGTAVLTVPVPAALAAGDHTVVAFGTAPDGTARSVTAPLTVVPAPTLAATGADVGDLVPAGVVLTVAGLACLLAVRGGRARRT